jgi:hypothetical protein
VGDDGVTQVGHAEPLAITRGDARPHLVDRDVSGAVEVRHHVLDAFDFGPEVSGVGFAIACLCGLTSW